MIKLIGITGRARSGKDTVANYLEDLLLCSVRYSLAAPIKRMLFGLLEADTLAEQQELMTNKEQDIDWLGCSPRKLLQVFGTEGAREHLGQAFWLKFLDRFCENTREMEESFVNAEESCPIYVLVPDVRFDNEAKHIKDKDGIIIRVVGDEERSKDVREHASERGISIRYVDHVIDNDGTLEDLKDKVKQLVKEGGLDE